MPFALVLLSASCSVGRYKQAAEQAVDNFHSQLNEERYQEIYDNADELFRNAQSETEITNIFRAIREKLGPLTGKTQSGFGVEMKPAGTFVTLVYSADFVKGKATEKFTWRVVNEKAVLVRYDINSPSLVTD
jgi:hypothetical protein